MPQLCIAKTTCRAGNLMIEALEEGGGFALLCFGVKLQPPMQGRAFSQLMAGELTPEDLLRMALSLVSEANWRLHFPKDRVLPENEQRLQKQIRSLMGSLDSLLAEAA